MKLEHARVAALAAVLAWGVPAQAQVSALEFDAAPEKRATLSVDSANELIMSLMKDPLTLSHFPWHSFDFDFTSLALAMPHLRNPEGTLRFRRTDFVYGDPPSVAVLGEVTLRFAGYDSVRVKFVEAQALSVEQWQRFKLHAIAGS